MSLEFTRNRVENSRNRVERFIDQNIVSWVEDEILGPTQQLGFAEGLSDNALGHMEVVKDGFMRAKVRWSFKGPNDEPLHLWLERGTKPHIIRALGLFSRIGKQSLRWIGPGGKPIFRKEVKHPGTKDLRIMERGFEQNKDKLKQRGIREVNNFLEAEKLG